MKLADFDTSLFSHPLTLRPWRSTEEEQRFIQAWLSLNLPDESQHAAALFHAASTSGLNRAAHFYTLLTESQVQPRQSTLPADDPGTQLIEGYLWAFLQTGKLALDALAREVNLIYWHLDVEKRFDDPLAKARWISFYMVRQRLLRCDEFRDDPISQLFKQRTTGETAEPAYRALSHLANVSFIVPLIIGPIVPAVESSGGTALLSQCRVLLPDDPREETLTYTQGFEVNETGREILRWLGQFMDEVYEALIISLNRLQDE